MATMMRLARPYVQAAFEYASESDVLEAWSNMLKALQRFVSDVRVSALIQNPTLAHGEALAFVVSLMQDSLPKGGKNFLALLAEQKRLLLLPDIAELFEVYKSAAEHKINVEITSVIPLQDSYLKTIKSKLSQRFNREVELRCVIDESLLGGAIIRAGDRVIDGSVRGQLQRLRQQLLNEGAR